MSEDPHSRALRRHRWTIDGAAYAVNTAVQDRRPVLGPLEAAIILDGLQFLRRERFARLLAFVVMPEHLHLVVEPLPPRDLSAVMKNLKNFTGRLINQLHEAEGRFWQPGYYERLIRDDRELVRQVNYVHHNPVEAGLVAKPEEYLFSSAHPSRIDFVD